MAMAPIQCCVFVTKHLVSNILVIYYEPIVDYVEIVSIFATIIERFVFASGRSFFAHRYDVILCLLVFS